MRAMRQVRRLCCRWRTVADCCWGRRFIVRRSQIALRLVSREAIAEAKWLELLAERLRSAIARRKPMLNAETDACRLCFSEADELPGLIVDKYGDLVILQLLTKGLDSAAVRAVCVRVLREELDPAAIVERPDPRMRELEGLSAPTTEALYLRGAEKSGGKKTAESADSHLGSHFRLNGLKFHFDADSGQKTGAFLDQRANYEAAREWARTTGHHRAGARCLLLPGRIRAAPGRGLQSGYGH